MAFPVHTIPSRPGTEVCTFTNKISFKNTLTVWTTNLTSRFRNKPKKALNRTNILTANASAQQRYKANLGREIKM